jgi:hypothetical protein
MTDAEGRTTEMIYTRTDRLFTANGVNEIYIARTGKPWREQ